MRKFSRNLACIATLVGCASITCSGHASDGNVSAKAVETKPAPAAAIAIEGTPAWIRERQIPESTSLRAESAQGGIAYLLTDEQYQSRSDGHDDWFRSSSKVTNRSGLESAGQISLNYDPSNESVGIGFVRLIRDGKVIDITRETQFRVVEREDSLDEGIVSGTLRVIANLHDVRVGDIVDYATITHTRAVLWPGHAFYHFSQRYSEAVALRTLRLVWPSGFAPRYKALNSDVAFASSKLADGSEWEWTAKDPPAMQAEDDVPPTAFQWGRIDVSTMKDWAELGRWAVGLYQGDETLPKDFAARLDAIANRWPTQGDRLTEATRYVQDNIRYVGEELAEGSYVPRRPGTVLARGYGDCKDKSLLLALALRRLGIDAVPALVSTRAGERLPDRLPSPLVFDHVIVRAVIDGKVIWVDPTGAHRGGRGDAIVPSHLGYALPIRAGQTSLVHMDGLDDRAGDAAVLEQFSVDEAAEVPLTLHVETRYTGARADYMRSVWANGSAAKLADSNLKFYRVRFAGMIESKPLELHDDRDANIITMTENYRMGREAFTSAEIAAKLITRAYLVQNVLPDRQNSPRVQPLDLADHLVNEQTIELHVKNRILNGLDNIDAKGGPIAFSRQTTKLPDGLRTTYRLNTGTSEVVPAATAEAAYAVSDKIKDEAGIEFYLAKAPRTAALPAGIDAASWALIESEREKLGPLLQKTDTASKLEALSILNAASAKVAHPSPTAGLLEGLKGALLGDLGRPQAALASLQSATAQYDGNPDVFRIWISYELSMGTADAIAKAMQRTRDVQPQVLAAVDKRWVAGAMQKAQALEPAKREKAREDMCIALYESGWQQVPLTAYGGNTLGCAIAAHSLRGELAKARAGLAKAPPTDTLVTLAIDRRHQALWPDIDRNNANGFRKSLESDAVRAAAAAKAAPKDYAAVMLQMQTLRALGRYEEALAVGKALAGDTAQIEIAGSDAFWLVNEYASNLHMLGRMDEAIAVMDRVLALGIDRYPELGSLAINRAEMLVEAGRLDAGLADLTKLERDHINEFSPYGKMWIWANTSCALRGMNRNEEAKALDAKLAVKPDDNWSAASAAAACRDDTKAIADMLLTRLRGSDTRPAALGLFITFEAPEAHSPLEKKMRQAMAKARAMSEVQAEFAKYGRVIRYAGTTQGWSEF